LLCANALLFAWGHGFLGGAEPEQREPARLRNQLAADRLVLLTGTQAQAIAQAAAPAETAAESNAASAAAEAPAETRAAARLTATEAPAAAPASPAVACVETDAFPAFEARRFETRLARLDLGERQTRLTVPFQEVTSHLVYLPPQGGKEGADRRTAELRERGVSNSFVMQGESPLKWAISLGVFKTEAAARSESARLTKLGIANVRILPRGPQSQRFAYRFRDIDAEIRNRVVEAGRGSPAAVLHSCR
jgi:hypothetical protein